MARSPKTPKRVAERAFDVADNGVRGKALVARKRKPSEPELFDELDPMPASVAPCPANLLDKPPTSELWWHEIKWDGYG